MWCPPVVSWFSFTPEQMSYLHLFTISPNVNPVTCTNLTNRNRGHGRTLNQVHNIGVMSHF